MSPAVMGAKGLLQAVGLKGSAGGRALLPSGCCWLAQRQLVARALGLPTPGLFLVRIRAATALTDCRWPHGMLEPLSAHGC